MEPTNLCHQDQPEISIEEANDQPYLQDVRSYECIYCKHGFTTAQALGGHMNVHRKDRSRKRSNSSNNKSDDRLYQPCLITSCIHSNHQEGQTHHEFMLRSSPAIYDSICGNQQIFNGLVTSSSQEEMRLSLSLQFGQSNEEEHVRVNDEGGELDLELRLGNYQ
ncbi:uncharacterized protein [Rutidosis leptorrhynchoides]|uniref:uncharacterized protein n=1 Tax=Rutidosis leptorrhynchoides TaxID=125765 RepID=UPI003A9A05C5